MSKTCLVCNNIQLEMIGILRHPKKLEAMLDSLLGLQAKQDDYICKKCCNEVIDAFESKQKSHQLGLFSTKVLKSDGAVIKNEVDQGDQYETTEVKNEPRYESLEEAVEDVNDGTTGINYEKMMTPDLESKIKQEWGGFEYELTAQESLEAIGGERESDSISSEKVGREIDCGEHSKRHKSIDIDDSTVEEKPNDDREDESFRYTTSSANHIEIHNRHADDRPANKKPYVFWESEKTVITLSKREIIERIHRVKPYKCCECGKSFVRHYDLEVHERIHTKEKPCKCHQCGKRFLTTSELKIHETNHSEKRFYKCCECGKLFTSSSYLKVHERIHTGEKPYKCQECEKCFTAYYHLKVHERVHTGERPYKCHECEKCFTTSTMLKVHERIHTRAKPYKCYECGKCFATRVELRIHEESHW